jgi:hypothetical protein
MFLKVFIPVLFKVSVGAIKAAGPFLFKVIYFIGLIQEIA